MRETPRSSRRLAAVAVLSAAALCVLWARPLSAQETVPSPTAQRRVHGDIDVRQRWVQDVGGSGDAYRSIVNLGEGPRLFDGTVRYFDPNGKLAERIELTAYSWGGDPHNTARLEAELPGAYRFRLDYRNVNYFNSLPTFANPFLGEGLQLSQRALDIQRRYIGSELEIKPHAAISPFFSFTRSEGFGRGITTFVADGNEFPVSTDLDDAVNSFRGGVRLRFSKYNVTLEQGYSDFRDDQTIFFEDGDNRGNRRTTLFGRELILDQLSQQYRARGNGVFNRAVIQGQPSERISFVGQFLYSQASFEIDYQQQASGNLFLLRTLRAYTGQIEQASGDAQRPHTSGSWTTEFRPHRRLRIVQSWFTDRFHIDGGSFLEQTFQTTPETQIDLAVSDLLVLNYNRNQIDVIYDANRWVTLRGGHRYVWGDARARQSTLGLTPHVGEIRRQVGLAGASFRVGAKLSVTTDFEASPGDRTLFRTGLMKYQKGKARARYQLTPSLSLNGTVFILNNQNPAPDVRFDFHSRQSSASIHWTPRGGGRFSLLADYTRSTLRTEIPVILPPFLERRTLRYRDNGHHGGLYAELGFSGDVRLSLGGSYSISAGSRPTRYYQPRVDFSVPLREQLAWKAEWRWYGFSERLFGYESFHTHVFSTGLRWAY